MSHPLRVSDCPNALHDWPLPSGYIAAHSTAEKRLRSRWRNTRCPDCGLYGWAPGDHKPGTRPVHVPPATDAPPAELIETYCRVIQLGCADDG